MMPSERKPIDKSPKKAHSRPPITIPMILKAQHADKENDIVKRVFWHHDFNSTFEDDVLWGKKVGDHNVRIYSSYIVARRYVYVGVKMCLFNDDIVTKSLIVHKKLLITKLLEEGYKICGILLEDVTTDPKNRFNQTFLELIATDIWNTLVNQAKHVQKVKDMKSEIDKYAPKSSTIED